jgi:hypothetical protein
VGGDHYAGYGAGVLDRNNILSLPNAAILCKVQELRTYSFFAIVAGGIRAIAKNNPHIRLRESE